MTGVCSCNARFLRLQLKGVGGADEALCTTQKSACGVCTTGLQSSTKRKEVDPKKYPNKVHTGPQDSGDAYSFSPENTAGITR